MSESERSKHERCMKPVCRAASLLPLPRVSRCTWGWLPFCPVPTPPMRLSLGSPGPFSVEGGRKDPWRLGEKVLCPPVGLPLVFMILTYTVPTVEANASCIAMYISTSGVVNTVVLCINKASLFLIFHRQISYHSFVI